MTDGLEYIREAIARKGPNTMVEVVRWEKDSATGYYNKPFRVSIKADIALKQLTQPLPKRSNVWRFIRPMGVGMDGNLLSTPANNRLNSPDLIEQLKRELRAELKAEMLKAQNAANDEEKPKRGRKPKAEEETKAAVEMVTVIDNLDELGHA